MGTFKDITGQTFNRLTAIKRTGIGKHGFAVWLFSCECGNEVERAGYSVTHNKTKSCGCYLRFGGAREFAKTRVKDLKGQRFGILTAIKPIHTPSQRMKWLCECDCGNTIKRSPDNLHRATNQSSCGCIKADNNRKRGLERCLDLTGKTFGLLTAIKVVSRKPSGSRLWFCQCKCGNTKDVGTTSLTKGATRSCGCLITPKGEKSPLWKGGFSKCCKGYIYQRIIDETDDRYGKRVPVHRLVMEKRIGRRLSQNENVHHINGNRGDNRPENLELWVKSQPSGQRASDLVSFARKILKTYENLFPE